MKIFTALLLGALLLGPQGIAAAGDGRDEGTVQQVGYGAGSVLGTLVYSPLKASFCILGGIAGAFTAIASPPTASKVVGASCRGTWEITPAALKGRDQVTFVGETHSASSRTASKR